MNVEDKVKLISKLSAERGYSEEVLECAIRAVRDYDVGAGCVFEEESALAVLGASKLANDFASFCESSYENSIGQKHTFSGERGDFVVSLKMRDIYMTMLRTFISMSEPSLEMMVKLRKKTWSLNDVYSSKCESLDPVALAQNVCVEIEKVLGIFPNIEPLKSNNAVDALIEVGALNSEEVYPTANDHNFKLEE